MLCIFDASTLTKWGFSYIFGRDPDLKNCSLYVIAHEEFGLTWNHSNNKLGYRGSYMSAHVLLNLINELGKRDKMRGLPSVIKTLKIAFFGVKTLRFSFVLRSVVMDAITFLINR